MKPPLQHSRINLFELKAQFIKKLGPEGSKQYFSLLHRFLSSKLTKFDFSKLCLRILGRENIPLHNRFMCLILKNACTAKSPPPAVYKDDVLKQSMQVECKEIVADGYLANGSHPRMNQSNGSNGILPISPRKARSGVRKIGDRRINAHEKTNVTPQVTANKSGDFNVVLEKEDLHSPNIERLEQNHQEMAQTSDNKDEILPSHHSKMSIARRSEEGSSLVNRKDQTDLVLRTDVALESAKSPLQAPREVLSPPVSIGSPLRTLPQGNRKQCADMFSRGALLDNVTLREQMEKIAILQGLNGVSVDCAEILNHGLDSYLKGLIRSCIEFVGERSGTKNDSYKNQTHMKLINGLRPGYRPQMQNSSSNLSVPISLQDFRVAMELNPRQLGEDWQLLLEKISTHSPEE